MEETKHMQLSTLCVHAGVSPDPTTGAILPPIYQNTTFAQESVENYMSKGFSYSRTSNPTVRCLEKKITALESGYDSCCFATGMAATVTVMSTFLKPGDHCLMPACLYGGSYRAAKQYFTEYKIEFSFVDYRNIDNIKDAIKPNTKMIFSETPANPTLWLTDLEAIHQLIQEVDKSILFVCDSTFATPCMLCPFEYGVDIIIHSTTKFFDGHNLTTGGCVVSKCKPHHDSIFFMRNVLGNIMAPQTAFYTLTTMCTLPLRFEKQCFNAFRLAKFLQSHEKVDQVIYPGLENFAQFSLAKKYHKNNMHGGMLGFEVKGGTPAGIKLMNTIAAPYTLCENLGTVQSLVTCPAVFTHAQFTKEYRESIGITDGFIRVSVGVEDIQDLISAMDIALNNL